MCVYTVAFGNFFRAFFTLWSNFIFVFRAVLNFYLIAFFCIYNRFINKSVIYVFMHCFLQNCHFSTTFKVIRVANFYVFFISCVENAINCFLFLLDGTSLFNPHLTFLCKIVHKVYTKASNNVHGINTANEPNHQVKSLNVYKPYALCVCHAYQIKVMTYQIYQNHRTAILTTRANNVVNSP